MKHLLLACSAIATFILATPISTPADPQAGQEMKAVQFLVGTWNCHHAEDSMTEGSYTTTYANALGNNWLKQTWDFAATASDSAMQGEWFFGYDARVNRWVRFGAMSDGMYFGMVGQYSNDAWSWRYVLPGSGNSTLTKKSDSEYTIDGPSYTIKGKLVTERHVCTKQ